MDTKQSTHIVIAGGGFGGVYAALELERLLRRTAAEQVRISIVCRENYLVFQPLLPEVVSGSINVLHAIAPIRRLLRRTTLYTREIEAIDIEKRVVRLAPSTRPKSILLPYDHLVIAMGNCRDDSKVPGAAEYAIPFKTLADALRLRNQLVHVLEQADIETDAEERRRLLTFVVAGGGFSGVECIAELNDFVRAAARAYRGFRADDMRVVLLQSADRLLPEMESGLASYAERILRRRGVEVRLNERLHAVSATDAFAFSKVDKSILAIPARTVVSTVPSGPHAILARLPCDRDGDRLRVNSYLEMPNWPGVWAIGDCAAVPQRDGATSPPTAQHALRQAKFCARNIVAELQGKPKSTFDFVGMGSLASVGQHAAVAQVMGIKLSGFLAWVMWRAVYLWKMPGLDRKVRVLADWLHDAVFPKDITQIRVYEASEVRTEHFEGGEIVFECGDLGDKVYSIVKGSAEVVVNGNVVRILQPGQIFGEIALVDKVARTATVRAAEPLDLVSVRKDAFEQLLAHFPGVQPAIDALLAQRRSDMKSRLVVER